jgi:FkbM family methyltransferase
MNNLSVLNKNIIYDLGAYDGIDTFYYLKKNYKVIAIEPDKNLCLKIKKNIKYYKKNLTIINKAISNSKKKINFYINRQDRKLNTNFVKNINYDNFKKIKVPPVNLIDLFKIYGVPFYIKIDIEKSELIALKQILKSKKKIPFISIEDCHLSFEYLKLLKKIGYKKFKLINQYNNQFLKDKSVNHKFHLHSSGKFGEEIDKKQKWSNYNNFLKKYIRIVRSKKNLKRISPAHIWYDIHAKL